MPAPTDALRAKTDAELLFFVENPSFYQPELVAAARRELQRRGALPAAPAVASPFDTNEPIAPARSSRALLIVALVVIAVLAAGLWRLNQQQTAARQAGARPGRLSPDSLKLESVVARPLPTFNIEQIVDAQLASIPAAEKGQAQALRQFRGLSRRFWTAETQTEYLTDQAHAGKTSSAFADQALVARETWRAWNKAAVYSYRFGPAMQAQYRRMGLAASSQQHVLSRLPNLLPERKFLTDKELLARDAEVQDWLAGVRPTSPVTGRPYRATVLKMQL